MANDFPTSQAIQGSSPLFVVGLYRSGTTLLYALLNQHPQIALMYETDALAVLGVRPSAARWPRWAIRNEIWNAVLTRHRLSLDEVLPNRDLQGLYKAVARRKGALYFGEKAPAYARYLWRMSAVFPGARFIILLRELSEVYQSRLDAGNRGSRFFKRKGQLPRMVWSHWKLLSTSKSLETTHPIFYVRYREIVEDPGGTARKLCEFLRLPYSEGMESLEAADLSAVYHAPHHEQVRKAVIERRSDRRASIGARLQRDLKAFSEMAGEEPYSPGEEMDTSGVQALRYRALLISGCLLCGLDDIKRLLYEYLPISWFQTYRRIRGRKLRRQPLDCNSEKSQT